MGIRRHCRPGSCLLRPHVRPGSPKRCGPRRCQRPVSVWVLPIPGHHRARWHPVAAFRPGLDSGFPVEFGHHQGHVYADHLHLVSALYWRFRRDSVRFLDDIFRPGAEAINGFGRGALYGRPLPEGRCDDAPRCYDGGCSGTTHVKDSEEGGKHQEYLGGLCCDGNPAVFVPGRHRDHELLSDGTRLVLHFPGLERLGRRVIQAHVRGLGEGGLDQEGFIRRFQTWLA